MPTSVSTTKPGQDYFRMRSYTRTLDLGNLRAFHLGGFEYRYCQGGDLSIYS